MRHRIPWGQPNITEKELEAVRNVFESKWLSMGPQTQALEKKVSDFVGRKFGIGVTNGTVALDVALKSIGVRRDDEVIVPAMAYIATATCILFQNARPVFVDIEPQTFNLDIGLIEEKLTSRTKAITFMDFGGHPADLLRLMRFAKEKGLFLVEDAAQSLGAKKNRIKCGSAGDISTTSFHLTKPMTTIEGGMVFTDDPELEKRARKIRNHGESEKHIHDVLGSNYRMTDISAAIGLEQFKRFGASLTERSRIAKRYSNNLRYIDGIDLQRVETDAIHSWFFFLVLVDKRDRVIEALDRNGIETRITYPLPLNRQKVFQEFSKGEFPIAEQFSKRVISLPMFPGLTDEEIDFICDVLVAAVRSTRK